MALSAHEIQLNRIAQGMMPVKEGVAWFEGLSPDDQRAVLRTLAFMTEQAHPHSAEVPVAIEEAGLKATFTPCVIVLRARLPEKGCVRLPSLPRHEWSKSFRLMLALFTLADRRRWKISCQNGCMHPWHNLPSQ